MRRLHLLRHMKAADKERPIADRDRPLAPRGQSDCEKLATHLAAHPIGPDLILCSTSERTRQSLAGIGPALAAGTERRFEERIYDGGSHELLELLAEVDAAVAAVLLVGHSPAVEGLAATLAGGGDAELLERMREKYPTGALATLEFERDWDALTPGCAELAGFVRPADL